MSTAVSGIRGVKLMSWSDAVPVRNCRLSPGCDHVTNGVGVELGVTVAVNVGVIVSVGVGVSVDVGVAVPVAVAVAV
jgi:hypothetical protein